MSQTQKTNVTVFLIVSKALEHKGIRTSIANAANGTTSFVLHANFFYNVAGPMLNWIMLYILILTAQRNLIL